MTTTTRSPEAPTFRVHARGPAFFRGAVVAALCAALTAGFIAHATSAPAAAGEVAACSASAHGARC